MDKKLEQLKKQYMNTPIPPELDSVVKRSLQVRNKKGGNAAMKWMIGVAASAALFVSSVNMSPTFAHNLSKIPVLGNLVKIVTIAEYKHEEQRFHADVKVPAITNMEN